MPEQTTHKIEELKFKLKNDPKSRLFYPLAEELRKIGRFEDAEKYLRAGLAYHASYLSAWVSLGRVLRETSKDQEAVDALKHALTVDPGNMVAAKLLAETYYDLGDKVEAIKKYKLVHALLPADDEISAKIEQLHRELNPPGIAVVEPPPLVVQQPTPAPPPLPPPAPPRVDEMLASDSVGLASAPTTELDTFAPEEPGMGTQPDLGNERQEISQRHQDLFDGAEEAPPPAVAMEPTMGGGGVLQSAVDVDHRQAMSLFEFSSPAEESFSDWGEAGKDPQRPAAQSGFDEAPEPSPADDSGRAYSLSDPTDASEGFSATHAPVEDEQLTATTTMAELYAQQGHFDSAREIYERLLEKDPDNGSLKKRLKELPREGSSQPSPPVAVERLQGWLRKIKGEASRV